MITITRIGGCSSKTYYVDEDDVDHSQEIDVPASENTLPGIPPELLARSPSDFSHSSLSYLDVVRLEVECSSIFWKVWQEEDACYGNRYAHASIDQEKPSPVS